MHHTVRVATLDLLRRVTGKLSTLPTSSTVLCSGFNVYWQDE